RLLLGLKGTMSEAELHLLAGRLQGAKRGAAGRGELRFPLPVGYVYDDDGATVMDPDAEVAAAVADLFAAFRAGGAAYPVVAAFHGRRLPRPPALPLRVRPLPRPPGGSPRRQGAHQARGAGPPAVAGGPPRPPPRLHLL